MDGERKGMYLGIEINDKYAMISYFQLHMNEPQTLSTVMGSENYQIPLLLAKKKGVGQWYIGNEARHRSSVGEAVLVEGILELALSRQEVFVDHQRFLARDLLTIYISRLLSMLGMSATRWPISRLTIVLDSVSMEHIELFSTVAAKLQIASDRLLLIDAQESFYYYALSQKPELYKKDVVLFDHRGSDLISTVLCRNTRTTPQLISLENNNLGKLLDNKDLQLLDIWNENFSEREISTVYLIGDGFDGDWAKESLQEICKGRKVFQGKNLYSKAACYCGAVKDEAVDWPFAYIGANELKLNLYLKVVSGNDMQLFTLLSAGESWLESKGECEVILEGTPEIEFYVQEPDCREAHIELLELTDLPNRQRRTTRLRISAIPSSDSEIDIEIRDLGFGEIVHSSGKTWEHRIVLEK